MNPDDANSIFEKTWLENKEKLEQEIKDKVPEGWERIFKGNIKEGDMTWSHGIWKPIAISETMIKGMDFGYPVSQLGTVIRKKVSNG